MIYNTQHFVYNVTPIDLCFLEVMTTQFPGSEISSSGVKCTQILRDKCGELGVNGVFSGHKNKDTIKQVSYYGPRSEYVMSGSDDGHIFFWAKKSGRIVKIIEGDSIGAINCLTPHPDIPMIITSGLEHTTKVWQPTGKRKKVLSINVKFGFKNLIIRFASWASRNRAWRKVDRGESPT